MYQCITELKQHQKLLKKAKDGFKATKHGRYGKPHPKFVNVSNNFDTIHWKDIEKKDKRKQHDYKEFTELKKGATTKIFARTIPKKEMDERGDCCLSLLAEKRSVDFEFKNKAERDEHFAILQAVFDQLKIQMPSKLKNDGFTLEQIQKCENALKKFAFDIEDANWKISKSLTRSAKFTDEEYSMLAACIENNPILTTIDLSENNVSDMALTNLVAKINKAPKLTTLTLAGNAISSEGLVQLSKLLMENKSIKVLDLRSNTITDNGAEALAKALSSNKTLEEIYLDKNSIGDDGACFLASYLDGHESIRILSLNDNNISNQGATDLANVFKGSKKVEKLRLARNQIIFPESKKDEPNDDEDGVDEDGDGSSLEVALFLAVDANNYAETLLLCLQGADPNVQNAEDGKTPLHLAASRGNYDMLEFLIGHPHIDFNVQDDEQVSPLCAAMVAKQVDVVKILLDKGADIKLGDKQKKTILHYASEMGDKNIVKLLIEQYNDDLLRTTDTEMTALHFASLCGHKAIVEYLLQRDDLERKEFYKKKKQNDEEVVAYVNYQDTLGETALHKICAGKQDAAIATLLIEKGADISLDDAQGHSALHYINDQLKQQLLNVSRRVKM